MEITHTIVIDTREQRPYEFASVPTVRTALPAGDYSIVGAETRFAIERKSLDDWVHTIVYAKKRFIRELRKFDMYDESYIIIEGDWQRMLHGEYASRTLPQSVTAITLAIMRAHPDTGVLLAGDRPTACALIEMLCASYARRMMGVPVAKPGTGLGVGCQVAGAGGGM